ncbi:DUF2634 domain-containing protein [Cohnella algarum]|uniref:DUF2634 domain-containing protein n=1 Tax=Cohnella algarum TaxID=2044859 RepID=UPI0019686814|nr:DUF2634 domain-containing protein [Cohnella algarum]MBN2980104.1 DUF2634 domain-containing protein [Cohnella algarum]
MSILPAGATPVTEDTVQTSHTYRIDFDKGRIAGMTDGVDAVKQAVYKIVDTERFAFLIYNDSYGRIRGPASEIQNLVTDALLQDDRITAVEDFEVTIGAGDTAVVTFTVVTIFGSIRVERSTSVNV